MSGVYYMVDPNATSTNAPTTLVFDHRPSGPLTRLQYRLWRRRSYRLGNLIADVRYWLWWLVR